MGLFDSIAGQVAGALGGGSQGEQPGMMQAVMGLINQNGGIQGLIGAFQEKGLGEVVSSWVGTGQNLPISGEQLSSVLGNEQVQAMAQKMGISPEALSSQLSNVLPQVVDQATPDGTIPEGGTLGALAGLFK
ncbi:MAG: YidB family protein [Betaproteobacteria bacterium]